MLVVFVALQLQPVKALAADDGRAFTQKTFVQAMFKQFLWEEGLPEKPADRDYLQILGGKRMFRYEAEVAYNEKTDRVSVNRSGLFGPFTGTGWLVGVSDRTAVHFTILLPIAGEYSLRAVIKGNGFVWNIGDRKFPADSGVQSFREVEIGRLSLKAGTVKLDVSVPPEGAIDSFVLIAPDYLPIKPLKGWRFKENLTAASLAEIAISMANLQTRLPMASTGKSVIISAAEVAQFAADVQRTNSGYLGAFTSQQWLRADFRGATIQIPLRVEETGFYEIAMNVLGEAIAGTVNDVPFRFEAKPYLEPVALGIFRLEEGDNRITLNLPPMGGVDTVTLIRKSTSVDDMLKLSEVKGPAGRPIAADEARSFLSTLKERYSVRK